MTLTLTLTYFWKNLTLAITFEPIEIGLSYFTCVFLVARPFCWKQNFLPRDLDLDLTYFWKNLTLTITFESKVIHVSILCDKTFLLIPIFFTSWPWPWLDLLLKKLNLDHNFWIKSDTCIYSLWQDLSVDTNIFDLVALTMTLTYFWKNLNWLPRGVLVPLGQTLI